MTFSEGTGVEEEQKLNAFGAARASREASISLAQSRVTSLQQGAVKTQDTIDVMREDLDRLFFELVAADNSFKIALQNRAGGKCGFIDMCMFIASVVAVVYTGGAAAVALASSAEKIFAEKPTDESGKPTGSTFEVAKYLVRSFVPAGKTIGEFQDAYGKWKKLTQTSTNPEAPTLPDDGTKLIAIKDSFDKQIAPFLDMPEAQKYNELMHTYISTADARNNTILELNSIYAQLGELHGEIAQAKQEIRDIDENSFLSFDPNLPLVRTFLDCANRRSKSEVAKLIYFMEKAYQYYAGEQAEVKIDDRSVALLQSATSSIRYRFDEAKRGFGRPLQMFQRKEVKLDKILTSSAWHQLRESGRFGFVIPRNAAEFRDYTSVLVRRVEFVFYGLQSTARVAKILQHGKSPITNSSGQWLEFSHLPVTAISEVDANGALVSDGTIVDVGEKDYSGVSPFGPWKCDAIGSIGRSRSRQDDFGSGSGPNPRGISPLGRTKTGLMESCL